MQIENALRGMSPWAEHARATDCPQGHPYDEENTIVTVDGGRICRTCKNDWMRANRPSRATTPGALRPDVSNAAKTHCKWGHPLSGNNLYIDRNGFRCCRQCNGDRTNRSNAKKRAA